jgi:hypothetical protein
MGSVRVNPRSRRAGGGKPVSITNARPSRSEELHYREVRYVIMMSFRAVCLVLATVLVYSHAPLLYIWIPILVAGMLVVPWLAVILANDRRVPRDRRSGHHLQDSAVPDQRAITEGDEPKTIDADPDD